MAVKKSLNFGKEKMIKKRWLKLVAKVKRWLKLRYRASFRQELARRSLKRVPHTSTQNSLAEFWDQILLYANPAGQGHRYCRCNKSAKQMHELFADFLNQFQMNADCIKPFLYEVISEVEKQQEDNVSEQKVIKSNLTEVQKKIDDLEERHFIKIEIPKPVYEKFLLKYQQEKKTIEENLCDSNIDISNLQNNLEKALNFTANLITAWSSTDYSSKEKLQKLMFPEGIYYNRQNHTFLTEKINLVFAQIADWKRLTDENKKGTFDKKYQKSLSAEEKGFEPLEPYGSTVFKTAAIDHSAIPPPQR